MASQPLQSYNINMWLLDGQIHTERVPQFNAVALGHTFRLNVV